MRKDPEAIKIGTEESNMHRRPDMKLNLRAAGEDCVNKRLQGRENPKTGRQRDPSLQGRHEHVDKVRGEETFIQRASEIKRKRQKLAKAGERERGGGGVGRETRKSWRFGERTSVGGVGKARTPSVKRPKQSCVQGAK